MEYNSTINSTWITNESTTMEYYYYSYDCNVATCQWCGSCESCIEKGCNWNQQFRSCYNDGSGEQWKTSDCSVFNTVQIVIIVAGCILGLVTCVVVIMYCKEKKTQRNNGIYS